MKKVRKATSILLAFVLVVTGMAFTPQQRAMAAETSSEEDTEEYTEIRTIDDLYAIRNDLKGKYILMNDIDLSEATAEGGDYDTGNGWVPIGDAYDYSTGTYRIFEGVFNGNGHYIKGMHIYGNVGCAGLFGYCRGATIKNLGMVDVDINVNGGRYVSAVCGSVKGSSTSYFNNCFVTGTIVNSNAYEGYSEEGTGGIIGYTDLFGLIKDCYSTAKIEKTDKDGKYINSCVAGFTGWIDWHSYTTNVYNCGMVNDGNGTAIDYNDDYSAYNSFRFYLQGTAKGDSSYDVPLTEAQMKSASFFTGFDFDNVWFMDPYSNYKYPQLRACPQTRIDSIEVKNLPDKTEYDQGEELDISGATVEFIYEDGLKQEIILTKDMLGDYDMTKVGEQAIPVIKNGVKTTFSINVRGIPVTSVNMSHTEASVVKGKTGVLTASVYPANATDQSVTWSVESGGEYIRIDQTGKITAMSRGTAVVRATASNGKYAECTVHVTIPCVMVQLNNYDVTILKGSTVAADEAIGYKLSPVDCTDSVRWTSSNERVLSIDNNGNMTGYAAGTVTVTALTTSGVSAICTVQVQRNINEFTILGVTNKQYTGSAITQKFTVSDGTTTLKENEDYTVSYQSNKEVGTAKIIITGIDPYLGTITKEFQILPASSKVDPSKSDDTVTETTVKKKPAKVQIKKVTAGRKKLTVTWKKAKGAEEYRVQVATNRKFTKGVKSYRVSADKLKKVCTGLKKKKTYYVRVRAKSMDAQSGYYGSGKYSNIKKKKTK